MIPLLTILSIGLNLLSRQSFLAGATLSPLPFLSQRQPNTHDDLVLPLQWLPVAGCLAVPIIVDDVYRYYAVVDTGSPFLTAPPQVLPWTRFAAPDTWEQYGATPAALAWRRTPQVLVGGVVRVQNCQLSIIPEELRQDTGGLFLGLIAQDDARPTFLHQVKRQSFTVDYGARTLTLYGARNDPLDSYDGTTSVDQSTASFKLTDLSPYGPDLYHYAVEVESLTLQTDKGDVSLQNCPRPIVVVIDTGLTGCIFSDSLEKDGCLPVPVEAIRGACLGLGNHCNLTSDATYWNLACFRLPWFTNDENHPHIVAAGATFLKQSRITVDAKRKRIQLSNLQQ